MRTILTSLTSLTSVTSVTFVTFVTPVTFFLHSSGLNSSLRFRSNSAGSGGFGNGDAL